MAEIIRTDLLEMDSRLGTNRSEWVYNGLDCCVTLEIFEKLRGQLDNVSGNTYGFAKELQAPVFSMMSRGLRVNKERKQEALKSTIAEIDLIAKQIDRIIVEGIGLPPVNWRSPAQLKTIFYDVLKLPVVKKRNAHGIWAPTINEEALEKLCHTYLGQPLAVRMLKLRDLEKQRQFLATGIDKDGRARTSLNIAGTNTGRLSSRESVYGTGGNQQNVDRRLREPFIADPGMKLGNIDIQQGDSRNVGAICWNLFAYKDEKFAGSYLDACESSDLHTTVCRMTWQDLAWPEDQSTWKKFADSLMFHGQDSYRQSAKKLGHGTNYYGKPRNMALETKIPVKLVEGFQERYFGAFPCIQAWHKHCANELLTHKVLTTLMGRRRQFFGRPNDDATLRKFISYEPQSLTADEINTVLLRLHKSGRVQLLMQVHDSILFQFPEKQEDDIISWILKECLVTISLVKGRMFTVPMDAKTGWNWGDATPKNEHGLKSWKGGDKRMRPDYCNKT